MSDLLLSPTLSDAALVELAIAIRQRHRGLLPVLRLTAEADGVVLDGIAANFYGKQMALHEVQSIAGLTVLANRITVICS